MFLPCIASCAFVSFTLSFTSVSVANEKVNADREASPNVKTNVFHHLQGNQIIWNNPPPPHPCCLAISVKIVRLPNTTKWMKTSASLESAVSNFTSSISCSLSQARRKSIFQVRIAMEEKDNVLASTARLRTQHSPLNCFEDFEIKQEGSFLTWPRSSFKILASSICRAFVMCQCHEKKIKSSKRCEKNLWKQRNQKGRGGKELALIQDCAN